MIISAFEFHKWHFIGQLFSSFVASSAHSETSLVQNLLNTLPAGFLQSDCWPSVTVLPVDLLLRSLHHTKSESCDGNKERSD